MNKHQPPTKSKVKVEVTAENSLTKILSCEMDLSWLTEYTS